ncbi:hypothetical protein Nm8I071_22290 [Nonomuraea sp. TT08I-71]|nr:hypothetical protein Nm8I071_22290 [Nonomuraea sp. TT08I-71]
MDPVEQVRGVVRPVIVLVGQQPQRHPGLSLSRKQLADPDVLRKALADAGVRAKITTDGTMCNSIPATRNMEAVFPSTKPEPDDTLTVTNAAAMKPGSMLVVELIEPGAGLVAFGFAWED